MPIRPENKARYPTDWKLRSRFVRFIRAKHCCEFCGVRNYSVGYRDEDGEFQCEWSYRKYSDARAKAIDLNELYWTDNKYIVIVLTVAHVHDHRPEAASLLNLAALCQRCHNILDMAMRQRNRKANCNLTLDMFACVNI